MFAFVNCHLALRHSTKSNLILGNKKKLEELYKTMSVDQEFIVVGLDTQSRFVSGTSTMCISSV